MDPNIFKNQEFESHTFDLVEKSDIYSLGVLLWELTSCSSPFNFENLDEFEKQRISLYILEGRREIPVPGTNYKFVDNLPIKGTVLKGSLNFGMVAYKLTYTHNFGNKALKEKRNRSTGAEDELHRVHN